MENQITKFLTGVKGCQFVSIKGYEPKSHPGEVADYVIAAGFSYKHLVEKRLNGLAEIDVADVVKRCAGYACKGGLAVTAADVDTALADLRASYQRTLDGVSTWNAADVFAPVVVDGITVCCARTYVGEKAAVPGTIYLSGLIVRKTVIRKADGPEKPEAVSRPDVKAKRVIEGMLPGGSIVSFVVRPEQASVINAHGETLDLDTL